MVLRFCLITLIFSCAFKVQCQDRVYFRFVDSYTYETIPSNEIRFINQKDYSSDSSGTFTSIFKPRKKNLRVTAQGFETKVFKLQLKKYWGDTLVRQLKPNQALISKHYQELFAPDTTNLDIVKFSSNGEALKLLNVYLNFITEINHVCDQGLCSYSNTFQYTVSFTKNEDTFSLDSFEPASRFKTYCPKVNAFVQNIQYVFPPFQLPPNSEVFSTPIIISSW